MSPLPSVRFDFSEVHAGWIRSSTTGTTSGCSSGSFYLGRGINACSLLTRYIQRYGGSGYSYSAIREANVEVEFNLEPDTILLNSPIARLSHWNHDNTSMHEIVYLQVGNLPNFIGTHFWNAQDAYSEEEIAQEISWSMRSSTQNERVCPHPVDVISGFIVSPEWYSS